MLEVGRVVDRHRRLLNRAAVWGVPAHVTVLYPFVPPSQIDAHTIEQVGVAVQQVAAFRCTFAEIRWFDDDVVWLRPTPDQPFRALTRAVVERFPEHQPYGGAHAEAVPHLTIGEHRMADTASMRRAAAEVEPALPLPATIDRVWLMAGADAPGAWHVVASLPLGPT